MSLTEKTHAESDVNPMYMLGIAIVLASLVLSASIYFSADQLARTLEQKPLTVSLPVFSPVVNVTIPSGVAALAAPSAAPAAAPTPSPTPSAAAGCGVPSGGSGAAGGAPTAIANIDVTGRPVEGSPNAKVTIVEFSEHLCPYSKRAQSTVAQIMKDYDGKVKHVYMHYFIHGEPPKKSAVAAECAGDQGKFWEYTALVFSDQKVDADSLNAKAVQLNLDMAKFSACIASPAKLAEVERQNALGQQNGVSGTPTFFINGRMIVGAQPYESFKPLIDAELAK